jgi:MFS family permease
MIGKRPPRPELFGLLIIPFGVAVGYQQVAMGYLLTFHVSKAAYINDLVVIAGYPHVIKFLWAPLLDTGASRRTWYLACAALTGVALFAASIVGPAHPTLYTVLATAAETFVATMSAAMGALMAVTLPPEMKGRAAGWNMGGNLGGTGVGGALAIFLARRLPGWETGAILAAICFTAATFALRIQEPPPERKEFWKPFVELLKLMVLLFKPFVAIGRRLVGKAGAPTTRRQLYDLAGLIICLSPVGAGAMLLVLPITGGTDYGASEHQIELVNGVLAGFVAAAGCLLGGYLADRMNRRLCYAIAGGLTALTAIGFALAPLTPNAFTVGALSYTFMNGIAYAAFSAFVLEAIGDKGAVTTKYTLFVAAANLAIQYMQYLDGHIHDRLGIRAMPWFDALATLGGCVVLGLMVLVMRWLSPRLAPDPEEVVETPAEALAAASSTAS